MSYYCHFMIAYTYEIKLISFVCNKHYSIFSFHSKFIVIEPPPILYDFASVRCLLSYQFYIKVEKSFLIRTIQLHSTLFKSLTCKIYISLQKYFDTDFQTKQSTLFARKHQNSETMSSSPFSRFIFFNYTKITSKENNILVNQS